MNPLTRHSKLLENKKVERWYSNLKARSQVTSDIYIRNFGLWLEYLNKDPESIISFAKDNFEEFKGSISDKIRDLESKGTMGASISTSIKPLISYLKFNNIVVKLGINIKNENRNLNAEKERKPEKEELSKILRMATMRERVSISLMAFSGLRPEVLGSIDGSDGLRIGDIKDLEIDGNKVQFKTVPARIVIRPELSKIRVQYYTFLGPEGVEYLTEYLQTRISQGENLNYESPVILPIEKQSLDKKNEFLMTTLLLRRIKANIIKAGFDWRPYIFRVYFGTNLDTAESKGLISHPWRQFIMGHKGDIEETYTKREGIAEEGREQYNKCLKFIETRDQGIREEDYQRLLRESAIQTLVAAFGITLTEDQRSELMSLETSEYEKRLSEIFKDKRAQILNNGNKHKTIPEKELESYLNKGWELVQIYPKGDKAVIKLP
jgi:integrase